MPLNKSTTCETVWTNACYTQTNHEAHSAFILMSILEFRKLQ